jgi:hypothetical protein
VIADPTDSYAFDFVVTGWHMVDWKYRNPHDPARLDFLKCHSVLRICEHLAVGAKHFKSARASLDSVTGTELRAELKLEHSTTLG